MQIFEVGGAVRDSLLGHRVKDRDWVVVGGTAQALLERGFQQVGANFPVFLHPDTKEEYALARTERKTAPGYQGFAVSFEPEVTLEDDLARRDLTINAMARGEDGEIIDPFDGQSDLHHGVLRHVTNAFVEDPLRILRVARFAARFGFRVADETHHLMQQMAASGELETLVAERVWTETSRALMERYPDRFISTLRDCNALAVVFPEIDQLFGVPHSRQFHPELDAGEYLLSRLRDCVEYNAALEVRFAVFAHDLGKGETPVASLPGHQSHEGSSIELIDALAKRLKVPTALREIAVLAAAHHRQIHHARELNASTMLELFEKTDALRRPDRFRVITQACEIARAIKSVSDGEDPPSAYLAEALALAQGVQLSENELLSLKGPEIAARLRSLRLAALSGMRNE
ncbi:MAG: multifunctional CCA addition/repair protein [Pseudomonadota bacterium]